MSVQQLKAKVLCPGKPVADVAASGVVLPAALGYMEILPEHASMVAEIDVGELVVKKSAGENLRYFISGGYVQVQNNEVVVLADVIEGQDAIDRERLEKAEKRANERLVAAQPDTDIPRALAAQRRAAARKEFLDSLPKR